MCHAKDGQIVFVAKKAGVRRHSIEWVLGQHFLVWMETAAIAAFDKVRACRSEAEHGNAVKRERR